MPRLKRIRKNQVVLYQGEASTMVYVVREGIVRAYSILNNGNQIIIAMFGPGDYFPVGESFSAAPASLFYYEMMCDGQIESYNMNEFLEYIRGRPDELGRSARRYAGAMLHINALGQGKAFERLCHTLRYLAIRFGVALSGNVFTRIDVKLTQQDLANLCMLSRETTSLELTKLKKSNVVIEKGKYYSVHIKKMNELLDDDLTWRLDA